MKPLYIIFALSLLATACREVPVVQIDDTKGDTL